MPTHEATTKLYRKLVEVLGQEHADTLFALLWEANRFEQIDFQAVYGADAGA